MKLRTVLLIVIVVAIAFFMIGSARAETENEVLGTFQLNVDDVEIYQTCNDCTTCNFTRVSGPGNQSLFTNLETTKDGTYYSYDVLKGNLTTVGEYTYCYECGNSELSEAGCINFYVTYTGEALTPEIGTLYAIALGALIFFFVLVVLLIGKLPAGNVVDEEGSIVQVSWLKHLRPVLWGVCWALILSMLFIVSNMAIAYLPGALVGTFFFTLYRMMFLITPVMFILCPILIFLRLFRDKEMKRMIERGVDIKTF